MIEEAIHLLRRMPLRISALYFIGAMPFALGFLYFIADMGNNAFAHERLPESVFSMVFLYLWMKCWQAVFCSHVRASVSGTETPKRTFSEIIRLCLSQTAIQPLAFIILPIALLITLPFGYAFAFFHNISLYGSGKNESLKSVCNAAFSQAKLFPMQNHLIIIILFVFGIFVFLNIMSAIIMIPYMIRSFLGIESVFTTAGSGIINTTLVAASFGLTCLFINPIAKTVYVLRCFYGESLYTGEDLKIALRRFRPTAVMLTALFAALLFFHVFTPAAGAAPATGQTQEAGLSTADLDRSLSKVISKKAYAWRLPREEIKKSGERGPFAEFIKGVVDTVAGWMNTLWEWIGDVLKWIIENIFDRLKPAPPDAADRSWSGATQLLLYALAVVAACALALLAYRIIGKRRRQVETAGVAMPQARDLSSEETTAVDLPMDEWLALARQMSEKGDLRLALRALYLGCLAHLSGRGILNIAKYKSNRDYEKELRRRAAHESDLVSAFSNNIGIFESAWYGMHDISPETYRHFNDTNERIMALANRL